MRLFVGLIGLLMALAMVGVVLRTQLKALRQPPASAAAGVAAETAASAAAPAALSQRMQRQVADDIGKAFEQGARRNNEGAEQ